MADSQTNLSKRIDDVEAALSAHFTTLENAHKLFEDWRPGVDATIDNFRVELGAMRKTMNRVVPNSKAASSVDLPTKTKMTAASASTGNPVIGLDGHHINTHHQGPEFQTHLSDKGMCGFPKLKLIQSKSHSLLESLGHQASLAGLLAKPKMATTSASSGNSVFGPNGHHVDTHHQGSGFQTRLPNKGTCGFPEPKLIWYASHSLLETLGHHASSADLLTKPKVVVVSGSTGNPVIGRDGHRNDTHHRGSGFQTCLPGKGTCGFRELKLVRSTPYSLLEVLVHHASSAGLLTKSEMATVSASVSNPVIGPDGHRVDTHHRRSRFETRLPPKGTCGFPEPKFICSASHSLLEYLGHHLLGARERRVRGIRNI
jgi:hypothetical protein